MKILKLCIGVTLASLFTPISTSSIEVIPKTEQICTKQGGVDKVTPQEEAHGIELGKEAKRPKRSKEKDSKVETGSTNTYSDTNIELLAHIAMAEAEGEDEIGKVLVMQVVRNRVRSNEFPNTVREVIYQPNQFSPILDGRWDKVTPTDECYRIAKNLDSYKDYSCGATYFTSSKEANTWHSRKLVYVLEHGNHRFYK